MLHLVSLRSSFEKLPGSIRGAIWMLFAAAMFACMGGFIRHLASDIHPLVLGFLRSVIGMLLILPFMARFGFGMIRTRRHGMFFLRGMFSALGQAFYFSAIAFLPMADAISLTFTAPLFGVVLAVALLGEKFRLPRWIATLVGFAGVLIVLRPGFGDVTLVTLTPLMAALSMSFIWVFVKMLADTEPTERIVFYMMAYAIPASLVPALFVWTTPALENVPWLIGLAVVANLGQVGMTNAYRAADATAVFPFDFARLPFTALIAYFVFAETPDAWTWVGASVIFGSTLFVVRHEARASARDASLTAAK
jgi:drug/metabolite transporter (DMT)-like permease